MLKMLRFKRCFSFYTKLGRWKIDHDLKIINIKIDQANKDNSDTYNFEKDFVKNPPVKDELKELKDDFLLPYCI